MRRILSVIVAAILYFTSLCYALETETHEAINDYIARYTLNNFYFNSYLNNQLGFLKGIEENVDSQKVLWWLQKGSRYEDKSPE